MKTFMKVNIPLFVQTILRALEIPIQDVLKIN